MKDFHSEEFMVVYVGKRQFSDVQSRFSRFGLEVEALTAGRIGIKGSFVNLEAAIWNMSKKVFAFQGEGRTYSGEAILTLIATPYLPTSWPPRPDSSSLLGPDDEGEDEDPAGHAEYESEFCDRM